MTSSDLRPHSVPPTPIDLRLSALGRRIAVSGPLAIVLADLAFGAQRRDDVTALHVTSAARIADTMGARL